MFCKIYTWNEGNLGSTSATCIVFFTSDLFPIKFLCQSRFTSYQNYEHYTYITPVAKLLASKPQCAAYCIAISSSSNFVTNIMLCSDSFSYNASIHCCMASFSLDVVGIQLQDGQRDDDDLKSFVYYVMYSEYSDETTSQLDSFKYEKLRSKLTLAIAHFRGSKYLSNVTYTIYLVNLNKLFCICHVFSQDWMRVTLLSESDGIKNTHWIGVTLYSESDGIKNT